MPVATVSVVTLAALTAYIVAGLLTLARVPDAGGPTRRLFELAVWPAVAVRTAASPARRHARGVPAEVAPSPAATQLQAAGTPAPNPAPVPASGEPADAAAPSAAPTPPAPTPAAVPDPAPRDARREWERFVLRLTELDD